MFLLDEIRFACRQLLAKPVFSLTVVFTLALGIGAASAVFSLVYGILLRPYPYAAPEQLVRVESVLTKSAGNIQGASLDEIRDWQESARTLAGVGAWLTLPNTMEVEGQAVAVTLTFVNAELFPLLGVRPAMGRGFEAAQNDVNGDVKKAILSHELWVGSFGRDPQILGKVITARGDRYSVIGVMGPGFRFPEQSDLWVPLMARYAGYQASWWRKRSYREHGVIARLKPGLSITEAQSEMTSFANRFAEQYRDTNEGVQYQLRSLRESETGQVASFLILLLGATGMVLLIGCLNTANLMLVRASSREKEIVIRAALGAGKWPLVRQALVESLCLALVGGALGVSLAYLFVETFPRLAPVDLPFWMKISLNAEVVAFASCLAILTGLIFGIAPAMHAMRVDQIGVLKQGSRGSSGSSAGARTLRNALVVAEVAISMVLLVGAGLLVQSFLRLQQVDMGVRTQGLVSIYMARFVPNASSDELVQQYSGSFDRALQSIRKMPNVISAAAATDVPYSLFGSQRESRENLQFTVLGQDSSEAFRNAPAEANYISPGFFKTLGVPLLEGRDFTDLDDRTKPNFVILNRRMAQDLFAGRSAIGQQVRWGTEGGFSTVIGVVDNIRYNPLESGQGYEIYYSYRQIPMPQMKAVISLQGDPNSLLPELRSAIQQADPRIAIVHAKTLDQLAGELLWQRRLWGVLFAAFALLALLLAAVGLYGVIAYLVEQRQREIGIRMALGASALGVVGLVLGQGARLVGLGLLVGATGALAFSQVLAGLVFGIEVRDASTFLGVALLLAGTSALACIAPAIRAAQVDPATAFRED